MLTTKHAIRQPLAALGPPLLRHTDILPQGKRSHTVILAALSPPSLRYTNILPHAKRSHSLIYKLVDKTVITQHDANA